VLDPELDATPFLPTRLLYLGDMEHVVQPRLVLSQNLKDAVKYCTLSHCWGPDPSRILRLTKDTLCPLQERINVARLSRVFREAMEIAKKLGFSYIWIDSLCIIQDDQADWRVEAATMGDIYYNSDLTVAATKSSDGQGGCWSSRQLFDITPCVVDIPLEAYGMPGVQRAICRGRLLWYNSITASPLLSRGWVTQEMFLSRRVLHCADGQLFWDCGSFRANETFPHGIPHANEKHGIRIHHPSGDSLADKYLAWDSALRAFSATTLTYPRKDKLLVLASIAKKLDLDDHLVAGLWMKCLPHQLLWRCQGGEWEIENDQSIYQAPSWSWASLNAPVSSGPTRGNTQHVYVTIRDVKVTHEEGDVRAPLVAGYLDIDAPLRKVTLPHEVGAARRERVQVYSPCAFVIAFTFDRRCRLTEVYLLWVGGGGIVVVPSEKCTGEYRRVGHFSLLNRDHAHAAAADPRVVFEHADGDDISHRGITRDHQDGVCRYSIRIV
jgi:hypothetical protein